MDPELKSVLSIEEEHRIIAAKTKNKVSAKPSDVSFDLIVSRKIIESLGGQLIATNTDNEHYVSTFTITLPMQMPYQSKLAS